MPIWVNQNFVIQKYLINFVNVVSPDINLSIVFFRVKVFEFKKVNLNIVFIYH